ncbi:MAG: CDP-diacylglycerol--glycerol-3-phosphate 3-phosphatidyltransferase [Clostridia bacterium]|nr:CDP-diacylglycerol--glycerol-3-phosphate 3-phosphatidyltransferase [Clostridia bacterium]
MSLPNKVTVFRIILIPLFMIFALPPASWYPGAFASFLENSGTVLAIAVFILAGITDIIDGNLARSRNEVSNLGKFLDPIADKLLVLSALLVLIVRSDISTWIVMIIMAREFMVMGIRMVAAGEGVVVAASIWGKIKTVTQIVAIVAVFLSDLIDIWYLGDILMGAAVLITIYSGLDYLVKNIRFITKPGK